MWSTIQHFGTRPYESPRPVQYAASLLHGVLRTMLPRYCSTCAWDPESGDVSSQPSFPLSSMKLPASLLSSYSAAAEAHSCRRAFSCAIRRRAWLADHCDIIQVRHTYDFGEESIACKRYSSVRIATAMRMWTPSGPEGLRHTQVEKKRGNLMRNSLLAAPS